ncbi:hypothetical protein FRC10_009857 [Ceratobasidium sp. 414]|nr:hypothetical protein FRC10_009857 [Ceratobasidium sp. 414]
MVPRPTRTNKPNLKAARANIRGYAARQARKAASGDALNVYEYTASRVRRATVPLALDREEEAVLGKDEDGDDELDEVKEKLRRQVANGDEEGVVLSSEDEEIDSDGAFEDESDEERFANFKFREPASKAKIRGKSKGEPRKSTVSFAVDINLNEDEASQEEDDALTPRPAVANSDSDSEAGEDDDEDEGEPGTMVDLSNMLDKGAESESEPESDSGSETGSDAPSIAASDPDASAKLATFVTGLDTSSKKRKQDDPTAERAAKKQALIRDRTEAGPEGEFGARSGPQPLTLTDLLTPAPQLTKSTKALQNTTKSALSAPLAQRTQDRLDREAAYAATKEEIHKWAPTMRRIREAEHLAFPLQGPGAGKGAGVSNADVVGRFQSSTPMESTISSLLRAAHLSTDAETAATENTLAAATVSPEDLAARRAQLRATRELMFRADIKAKRVAKIKSKAYRRMKKREREKLAEIGMDNEGEDEDEERVKAETIRAKERATLRHRTTGKWAQAMRRKGEMGEEDMDAMHSLVDRSEVLRRKIMGEDESSEDDEGGQERDVRELEELGQVDGVGEGAVKGIMGMKFMKDAVGRADREAAGMADETRLELLGLEQDTDAENGLGDETVGGNMGRRVYKPGQVKLQQTYSDISSTLKSSESTPTDIATPLPPVSGLNAPSRSPPSDVAPVPTIGLVPTSNPWLASKPVTGGKIARKSNVADTTKMQKVLGKSESERARAWEDAVVEIDMAQAMVFSESGNGGREAKETQGEKVEGVKVDGAYQDSSDEGSDVDERGPAAFKQRELVAMAFAGDNVVEDFSVEKQRVIEEDAPKEVDTTLPGWGSWGGRGTKKSAPRPNLIKKIAGVDASKRADAGKSHVIISEKRDKKAAKYLVKDLPYPYTSKEQFARSMATPIGTEWNTRMAHQRATLPKVVKKVNFALKLVVSPNALLAEFKQLFYEELDAQQDIDSS